ncbi:MAG TPA: hypothetical protein VMT70_03715 [Vicinamibacteria bacterium]|nr:hypothetical protein [Vicinamibacteria bacterium]
MAAPTPRRVWIARGLAIAVDLVQIALPPTSVVPFVDVAIDVATAAAMVALVGWHWAFLPTFLAEAIPFVDLVPTWTLAVMIATRGRAEVAPSAVVVRPSPAPPPLPPPGQAPRDGSGS